MRKLTFILALLAFCLPSLASADAGCSTPRTSEALVAELSEAADSVDLALILPAPSAPALDETLAASQAVAGCVEGTWITRYFVDCCTNRQRMDAVLECRSGLWVWVKEICVTIASCVPR
jgi:hypothetical protein